MPPGNCNLVYAVIRKRGLFHHLANLPTDAAAIHKALQRRRRTPEPTLSRSGSQDGSFLEGARPAAPAEPGTLKTSLVATPGLLRGVPSGKGYHPFLAKPWLRSKRRGRGVGGLGEAQGDRLSQGTSGVPYSTPCRH